MRSNLVFAFAFSLALTPALAGEPIAAHLEFGGGVLNVPSLGQLTAVDVAGRFNVAFGDGWNVEVEVNFDARFNATTNWSVVYPVVHLWKGTEDAAGGVLAGVAFPNNPGGQIAFAGVEGEAYLDGVTTIGGQAIFNVFSTAGCCVANFTTLRGWIEQYVTPDLRAGLSAAVFVPHGVFSPAITRWFVEGKLEHRMSGTGVSGFALARYLQQGGSSGWLGMIGVRLFADRPANTLRGHDLEVPWDVIMPLIEGNGGEPEPG